MTAGIPRQNGRTGQRTAFECCALGIGDQRRPAQALRTRQTRQPGSGQLAPLAGRSGRGMGLQLLQGQHAIQLHLQALFQRQLDLAGITVELALHPQRFPVMNQRTETDHGQCGQQHGPQ